MEAELRKLRVVDLREKLKDAGLPTSGKKAELVARLLEAETPADEADDVADDNQSNKSEDADAVVADGSAEKSDSAKPAPAVAAEPAALDANLTAVDEDTEVAYESQDDAIQKKSASVSGSEHEENAAAKESPEDTTKTSLKRKLQETASPSTSKKQKSGSAWGGQPASTISSTTLEAVIHSQSPKAAVAAAVTQALKSESNKPAPAPAAAEAVPAPKGEPTNTLRIDNLTRPFSAMSLKRYLSKTGTVVADGIWMDAIKTHAYVTFETTEQAIATRLAIYGRQWPEVHGKVLTVEFSTETATEHEAALKQEEEQKLKAMAAAKLAAERRRQQREADLQAAREKREAEGAARRAEAAAAEPVPDPLAPEPVKTLDTLFRATVTEPKLYWLPLSDDAAAQKRDRMPQPMDRTRLERMAERAMMDRQDRFGANPRFSRDFSGRMADRRDARRPFNGRRDRDRRSPDRDSQERAPTDRLEGGRGVTVGGMRAFA